MVVMMMGVSGMCVCDEWMYGELFDCVLMFVCVLEDFGYDVLLRLLGVGMGNV